MATIKTPDGPRVIETVHKTNFPFPAGGSKKQRQRPNVQVTTDTLSPEPQQQRQAAPPAAQDPPPPQSVTDPLFTSIDLPSGFIFYQFKHLSVAQIRGKHQAKFALAAKRQSTRVTVEAITSLLGDGIQAKDLSIADFYAVMYWLRLNCMGKSTFNVHANCTDNDHLIKVAKGELPAETLKNSTLVSHTDLKQTDIDPKAVIEFMNRDDVKELEALGYTLTSPKMIDSIELEEVWEDKPEYAEIEFLTDLAGSIASVDKSMSLTLTERFEIVGNLEAKFIGVIRDWQEIVQSYGIEESVSLRCKECGAKIETELSISAHDFL